MTATLNIPLMFYILALYRRYKAKLKYLQMTETLTWFKNEKKKVSLREKLHFKVADKKRWLFKIWSGSLNDLTGNWVWLR